jgi:hypothetical protein
MPETTRQHKLYAPTVPWIMAQAAEKGRVEKLMCYALREWTESVGEGHIENALGVDNEITHVCRCMTANFELLCREEEES